MFSLLLSILVAILGVVAFYAGIFDRPAFTVRSLDQPLYAIVATTSEPDYGKHIMRLMTSVKAGLDSVADAEDLAEAAKSYGAPEGAAATGIGLYFDDPATTDHPRWAVGWLVAADNYGDVVLMAGAVGEAVENLKEPVRAVRIVPGEVLAASVPWRFFLTPMIQARLQWPRAGAAFEAGGYAADAGRPDAGPVGLEVYVTGPGDSFEKIDYMFLLGDVSTTWNDAFPLQEVDEEQEEVIAEAEDEEMDSEDDEEEEDVYEDSDDEEEEEEEYFHDEEEEEYEYEEDSGDGEYDEEEDFDEEQEEYDDEDEEAAEEYIPVHTELEPEEPQSIPVEGNEPVPDDGSHEDEEAPEETHQAEAAGEHEAPEAEAQPEEVAPEEPQIEAEATPEEAIQHEMDGAEHVQQE